MNTTQNPRRRPRQRSVSFRSLWWLTARVAYENTFAADAHLAHVWLRCPRWVFASTTYLRRQVERAIELDPKARYYP